MKTLILITLLLLTNISNSAPIIFYSPNDSDKQGTSATGIGDFNGDGFDDFIITATNYLGSIGTMYIYFGKSPYPGTPPFPDITVNDGSVPDEFGNYVAGNLDINDDGFKDIIVGAPGYSVSMGRAYVFFGRCSTNTSITTLNCDFVIDGENPQDRFGACVASAGDLNRDCIDDFMLSAPGWNFQTGRVYIFYGKKNFPSTGFFTPLPAASADNIKTGSNFFENFGISTSSLGDLDNDGYNDIIIGTLLATGGLNFANVYTGGSASITLSRKYIGPSNQFYGAMVAGINDINGNGTKDFIIGDYWANGKVYVYDGTNIPSPPTTSTALTIPNIEIIGEPSANTYGNFGNSAAGVGDFDGNGSNDFMIGAWQYTNGIGDLKGRVYKFYGSCGLGLPNPSPGGIPTLSINASSVAAADKYSGTTTNDYMGNCVRGAGDINGDGRNDVIWGASGYSNPSPPTANGGAAFVELSTSSTTSFTRINMRALLQGYMTGPGTMVPTKIRISLYDNNCKFIDEKVTGLNSNGSVIDADGTPGVKFNNLYPSCIIGNYYIVLKSMCNSIVTTWSANTIAMARGTSYPYNFTTGVNKAYGNNQILIGSTAAVFSGDVNDDCIIDIQDLISIYNDANILAGGVCCLKTDLTGDNFVDNSDVIMCHNNSTNIVGCISPCTCP